MSYGPIQPVAAVGDAELFLEEASRIMCFGVIQFSTVMDVGCGIGDSSFALAAMFPNVNHIIGVDVDEENLTIARHRRTVCNAVQFIKGNIETGEGLYQFRGIRHIVSIHCFSCLKRQKKGFETVHNLLCTGGGAAILFAVQMEYYNFLSNVLNHPKWKQFMKSREDIIPESHDKQYDENHYRQLLTEIGFEIQSCRTEKVFSSYRDADNLYNWVLASMPFKQPLPQNRLKEFIEDLPYLLRRHTVGNGLECRMYYKIIKIIVFKRKVLSDESPKPSPATTPTEDCDKSISNILVRNQ